jgi:hypothetical protein
MNIADVELQPKPPAFAATGPAAAVFDARMGQVTTRLGAQKHPIRQGDIIACPPGADGKPQGFRYIGKSELAVGYWDGEGTP